MSSNASRKGAIVTGKSTETPRTPSLAEKAWIAFRDRLLELSESGDDFEKFGIVEAYLRVLGYLESKSYQGTLADLLDVQAALRRRLQQAEMVFYRDLANTVIRDNIALHALGRSQDKIVQKVKAAMASGRVKGAQANQTRAMRWRKFAMDCARDCWTGNTEARFWSVDKVADYLVPKIRSHCHTNVAAGTVAKAIGGVKRKLSEGR